MSKYRHPSGGAGSECVLTRRPRLLQQVEKTIGDGWANITDLGVEASSTFPVVTELRVDGTRSQVTPVNIFRRLMTKEFFGHLAGFTTVVRALDNLGMSPSRQGRIYDISLLA